MGTSQTKEDEFNNIEVYSCSAMIKQIDAFKTETLNK
jgi:hypothetical protein